MRIIGGSHAGLRLQPPSNLPVRPTTDMAKEGLFNILHHRIDVEGMQALDLFSGTGNIAFELASRGAARVVAVDIHFKCVQYIEQAAQKMGLTAVKTIKADVLKYVATSKEAFDFIFADPPYDLPQLPQLPSLIRKRGLLRPEGLLVIEHPSTRKLETHPTWVDVETRKYGYSSFTFYRG